MDVFVLGDAVVDVFTRIKNIGGIRRGGAVFSPDFKLCAGGTAGVALYCAYSGVSAGFSGCVGRDFLGSFFEKQLRGLGVEPLLCFSGKKTGVCVCLVEDSGERSFVTFKGACDDLCLADGWTQQVKKAAFFYTDGYSLRLPCVGEALRCAKESGKTTCFDPGSYTLFSGNKKLFLKTVGDFVDVLLLNESEATALFGSFSRRVLSKSGPGLVVLKRGARGSVLFDSRKDLVVKTPAVGGRAVDTTGAGDAFNAGFLSALARGRSVEKACFDANSLAGRVVSRFGPLWAAEGV